MASGPSAMPLARPRLGTVLVIASLGALLAAGSTYLSVRSSGKSSAPPPARTPDLIVSPESGDIGDVWESESAVVRVPIRNTTDRTVRITHFSSDCRVQRIEPRACNVPPHSEVTVAVTLDLTERRPAEFGLLSRQFSFRLDAGVE